MIRDVTDLVVALSPIVAAVASTVALIIGMLNTSRLASVRAATEEIHKSTNSMKDQLIAVTAEKEHAAGVAVGRQEVINEVGAAAVARETLAAKREP